eukprot:138678-Chlamydomonas_euryale.AAC.2
MVAVVEACKRERAQTGGGVGGLGHKVRSGAEIRGGGRKWGGVPREGGGADGRRGGFRTGGGK